MKKAVSHQVPKADGRKDLYQKLDVNDLDEIIDIDVEKNMYFTDLVQPLKKVVGVTLAYGLVPLVVPELDDYDRRAQFQEIHRIHVIQIWRIS